MTPELARRMYRSQIDAYGQRVRLRRIQGAAGTVIAEVELWAKVTGYKPEEMVGDFKLGDFRVIFLAEDVAAFPLPIRVNGTDKLLIGDSQLIYGIQSVDDRTRNIAGQLIAYDLRVRG